MIHIEPHKSSVVFRAIIKDRPGKAITSKTFTRKTDATTWAKRLEADRELLAALGHGSRMTFAQLTDEYAAQWQGKDQFWINRKSYWVSQIGTCYLHDITTDLMRQKLKDYQQGACIRGNSRTKGKSVTFDRARSPATVNRHKNTLSGIFKYAVQQGYLADNPMVRISRLKEQNNKIRYLRTLSAPRF